MFGGKGKRLTEQAADQLSSSFTELLKVYRTKACDYYDRHFRDFSMPQIPDPIASEARMWSLIAALSMRSALDEIAASPKKFSYGEAREYASSQLVEALISRFMMGVPEVFPKSDMAQVNEFLADPKVRSVSRWDLSN